MENSHNASSDVLECPQPREEKMCLGVKNQAEARKVCQPVTLGPAVTRRLQASAGQVATEALSVITNKS